ncbi:MAG TPA: C40 family peptidase [Gemmatimonadales bacterium]|jgi:cell wall-associated NlpC family hydrolase|nr:C40 family peptidase [Gemmatimonadales bacterium]
MKTFFTAAALAAAALLGGPLRAHAQDKPFTALSRTLLAGRDSLVHLAREQVGLRYRWGAVRPGLAFDCSGLVKWLLATFDLSVPRTAAQQARVGIAVPRDTAQLLPGDLLFFGRGRRVSHIGIYVGEGKYVHAANRRKGVIESDITQVSPTWWKGARRLPLEPDSSLSGVRIQNSELRGPSPHL